MRCPLLLGRYIWIRFRSRSYQTLFPEPDGRVFGKLILSHIDDVPGGAGAHTRNYKAPGVLTTLTRR